MGRLIFYYGTMGCSKTANALMTRFQYIDRQKSVWLIKPAIDTRDDVIEESVPVEDLLRNSDATDGDEIEVPKVVG